MILRGRSLVQEGNSAQFFEGPPPHSSFFFHEGGNYWGSWIAFSGHWNELGKCATGFVTRNRERTLKCMSSYRRNYRRNGDCRTFSQFPLHCHRHCAMIDSGEEIDWMSCTVLVPPIVWKEAETVVVLPGGNSQMSLLVGNGWKWIFLSLTQQGAYSFLSDTR